MESTFLFCLPFAGGNRFSYRLYEQHAHTLLRVSTLELPGRGKRMQEPLLKDIHHMVDDAFENLIRLITRGRPYAIYGHSMGGLLAYLLTHRLVENQIQLPKHIFVTGTDAPSVEIEEHQKKHTLPRVGFIDELQKYNGLPESILKDEDMLDFILPVILADFQATENYRHVVKKKLDIPITVITGTQEELVEADIQKWRDESSSVRFLKMKGAHFFIHQHYKEVLRIIETTVLK